jgi:hypothetical protein
MTTTKASRAVITLGDIQLDVFQLPDETYFMSSSNIAEALDMTEYSFRGKYMSKELKAILETSPRFVVFGEKLSIEDNNVKVNAIPLELVSLIFGHYASKGNVKATALLIASLTEALERRADAAFGIKRTEEEYNQRLVIRRDGILSRFFWTDVIDEYLRTHEVSDNYKRFIYNHVSDMVNKAVLGMTAKQFRESQGLPDGITTRDYCTTAQLKQIDTIENAAAMRVKRDDICPKQALKDIISLIC